MKKIILVLIIALSFFLRFYKLAEVPPSISWDEAAVGYNAWTILHWGKDEWGKTLPLVFKSFEDYKHPVHIYLTVPFIGIFGLNEFGVRVSSAFFGVLNVFLIYLLASKIFNNKWVGIVSALVLAVSPYSLQFSRFNHELNFAVFFFMLGLYFFFEGLEKKKWLLILGSASLGLDLLTYHSAKIVVPPIFLFLIALYFKDLIKIKKHFLVGILVFSFFASLLFVEPELLGGTRFNQTSSPEDRKIENIIKNYKTHFSYNYLFVSGDKNARHSSQQTGEFYKMDFPFLILGICALLWDLIKNKRREALVILAWAVLGPIPASIGSEAPHAARAMFMAGSMHIILAFGIWTFVSITKNKYWKMITVAIFLGAYIYSLIPYIENYYLIYPKKYAIEWQYGMKRVVEYVKENPNYYKIYVDNIRQQPYIFFLFYLKTPLPQLLKTVNYDESNVKSYNTVRSFDKFRFGGWNPIESYPGERILYVITPSYFTGLRYKDSFDVNRLVRYPNGTDSFYLVSGHEL